MFPGTGGSVGCQQRHYSLNIPAPIGTGFLKVSRLSLSRSVQYFARKSEVPVSCTPLYSDRRTIDRHAEEDDSMKLESNSVSVVNAVGPAERLIRRPVTVVLTLGLLISAILIPSRSAVAQETEAATRQYAKRQSTWFRNSFDDTWRLMH